LGAKAEVEGMKEALDSGFAGAGAGAELVGAEEVAGVLFLKEKLGASVGAGEAGGTFSSISPSSVVDASSSSSESTAFSCSVDVDCGEAELELDADESSSMRRLASCVARFECSSFSFCACASCPCFSLSSLAAAVVLRLLSLFGAVLSRRSSTDSFFSPSFSFSSLFLFASSFAF
jgi:hypothetical protein